MSISKNCMIVNVSVGVWTGYRFDRNATKQITDATNADADAARVSKSLVSKTTIDPIVAAAAMIRKHLYTSTLPWKDNGDRLLPRASYMKFIQEHESRVTTFKRCVEEFLTNAYPQARAQAEFRLGTMFKASDYPEADALRSKFYVQLDIDPVTESGDFRVDMDASRLTEIREGIERATQERIGRAMQDVWARLADTLGHYTEKMSTDSVFRDSTVNNLREIVDLLPELNILSDAKLDQIRQQIQSDLLPYTAKDLRKDDKLKQEIATDAKRIMEDMQSFMSAFGGK